MPRAFLVAVCTDSALDQRSNNFSLFHLIEQIQLPQVPAVLPFDVHAYFEFDQSEIGRPHQLRFRIDGADGLPVSATAPVQVVTTTRRYRHVSTGLHIPSAGALHIFAEIRADGEEQGVAWVTSAVGWPLEVEIAPPQ